MSQGIAPHDVPVNIPLPPSPSSSVSSADDAINVPTARVFFGAMQSPEKKIVSRNARRKTLRTPPVKSPTRRSARLSLAPAPVFAQLPSEDEEDAVREALGEEDGGSSTESAGDRDDIFQDDVEPSSALAAKISRAHDNPSPPPQMGDLTAEDDIGFDVETRHNSPRLIDISPSDGPDSPLARGPPGAPSFSSTEFLVSPFSPPLVTVDANNPPLSAMLVENEDLISFNVTHTEFDAPLVAGQPSEVAVKLQAQEGLQIVQSPVSPEVTKPAVSSQPVIFNTSTGPETTAEHPVCDDVSTLPRSTIAETSPAPLGSSSPTAQFVTPPPPTGNFLGIPSPSPLRRSPRFSPSPQPTQTFQPPPQYSQPPASPSPTPLVTEGPAPGPSARPSPLPNDDKQMAPIAHRRLSSLSPGSASVLSNLLSADVLSSNEDSVPAFTFPVVAPRMVPSTPQRRLTSPQLPPQALPTPLPNVQRPPPSQSHLHNRIGSTPSKVAETPRSQAKRIPIDQAFAQGSASARKALQSSNIFKTDSMPDSSTGLLGGPVFTRQPPGSVSRSPARRIPVPSASSPAKAPHLGSPGKPVRAGSAEPQLLRKVASSVKPPSKALSASEMSSPSRPRTVLPYPIRPINGKPATKVPDLIPEEDEATLSPSPVANTSRSQAPSSSTKSNLRQPSSMTGSRIPRIGSKPYARPVEKEKVKEKAPLPEPEGKGKEPEHKLVQVARKASTRPQTLQLGQPMRLVKSSSGSGSSSDSLQSAGPSTRVPSTSQASGTTVLTSLTSSPSLKRKRVAEKGLSPPGPQMQVRIRQVPPVPRPSKPPVSSMPSVAASGSSPVKKARIVPMRMVEAPPRRAPAATPARVPSPVISHPAPSLDQEKGRPGAKDPPSDPTSSVSSLRLEASASVCATSEPARSPSLPSSTENGEMSVPSPVDPPSDPPEIPDTSVNDVSSSGRRTRSGRTPQPTTDVFGVVRPLKSRRRTTQGQLDSGGFSTMSVVALKALTAANTSKNEQYIARLETEVIRKAGERPESPAPKLRTVLEKQKDEQERSRRERAERRAKRASGTTDMSEAEEDDRNGQGVEDGEPLDEDGRPLRHRRGPGDEEDFITPDRPERPAKRVKLDGENEQSRAEKRVRWDRGLFNTVYFEHEHPLTFEPPPKTPATKKGVLAGSAKTVRLDPLGNLLNCSSPIKDIVPEHIVVKKFVYDNDDEVQPPDPPKPAKGKGKKARS